MNNIKRLPNISPGFPTAIDPATVPHRATETVTPRVESVRLKNWVMYLVVPEITAVSNPKRKLPRADTMVANNKFLFNCSSPEN